MSDCSKTVVVSGGFDRIDSDLFRFMHEASKLGRLKVSLWSDALIEEKQGRPPKCDLAERQYVMNALRYVDEVAVAERLFSSHALPSTVQGSTIWAVTEAEDSPAKRAYCRSTGIEYKVIADSRLQGFPEMAAAPTERNGKNIVVTGCYDWLHSGHVRFFEEVSEHGNLHVVVGHDENLRLLKGEGHPMFKQDLRRYMVQSIRFVTQAYISTGHGWMDAEPEIARLKPDIYAVNSDGDKPEKREFCRTHGLEYLVLNREPKPGLTKRTSTDLRGF